jgi:NAD(P)H-dependent FMN reductase
MKYAILSGSHRANSQSLKVSRYVSHVIQKTQSDASVDILELTENPLPLWDESFWSGDAKWEKTWKPFSDRLRAAEALVVVSPEWAGMVPPGLKNFFLFCSKGELAHKPAMIVTVSAGINGAYPVAELRMTSAKNNAMLYIPDHVIVRTAAKMLNDHEKAADENDEALRKRIEYSVGVLRQYGLALKQVRESGAINLKDYPFGM